MKNNSSAFFCLIILLFCAPVYGTATADGVAPIENLDSLETGALNEAVDNYKNAVNAHDKAVKAAKKAKGNPSEAQAEADKRKAKEDRDKAAKELMKQAKQQGYNKEAVNEFKDRVKAENKSATEGAEPTKQTASEASAPAAEGSPATETAKPPPGWTKGENGSPQFKGSDGKTYSTADNKSAEAYQNAMDNYNKNPIPENLNNLMNEVKNLKMIDSNGNELSHLGGGRVAGTDNHFQHAFGEAGSKPTQIWDNGAATNGQSSVMDAKGNLQGFKNFGSGFDNYWSSEFARDQSGLQVLDNDGFVNDMGKSYTVNYDNSTLDQIGGKGKMIPFGNRGMTGGLPTTSTISYGNTTLNVGTKVTPKGTIDLVD